MTCGSGINRGIHGTFLSDLMIWTHVLKKLKPCAMIAANPSAGATNALGSVAMTICNSLRIYLPKLRVNFALIMKDF